MNAQHTPTPWTADDGAVWYGDRPIRVLIADCSPAGGNDHAIGDATFIVRACNAHDELVAALREIAQMQPGQPKLDMSAKVGDANAVAFDYQRIARAALARVNA